MGAKPHGIIIFGASGAGTTTLGRELARALDFSHFDLDDFFWEDTHIPFTVKRLREERITRLQAAIAGARGFVFSGSMCEWCESFLPLFDLAVFVSAPAELRAERLHKRELEEFGARVLPGGDMYENHRDFVAWAKTYDYDDCTIGRSRRLHEAWIQALPCPVLRIDGTADYRQTASEIANRYYTKPGEPWRVTIAQSGALEKYRYSVIFARHGANWLYARHKERDTFETAGGHIEAGETPLDCAKRELYEETGATKFFIHPAFDYAVHRDNEFSYGQVFYADVTELGTLPPGSEMAEVRAFPGIPEKMTYPPVLPVLYAEMNRWLGWEHVKDEYWDVLDEGRRPTGRVHRRVDDMRPGDYHLVVAVWIANSNGDLLITRRARNKLGFPGRWEVPAGSAVAGEDSRTAALRETREESGLVLNPENATLFFTCCSGNSFWDSWLFRQDFDLADVVLQEGETIDARAATWDEISAMMDCEEFIPRERIPEFDLLKELL
ncbi:MAG: NUDIX domain-containing protein [Clostridiales bacterium]|nr:NUDIX domain-containing protein [Clostridiales bacterium]